MEDVVKMGQMTHVIEMLQHLESGGYVKLIWETDIGYDIVFGNHKIPTQLVSSCEKILNEMVEMKLISTKDGESLGYKQSTIYKTMTDDEIRQVRIDALRDELDYYQSKADEKRREVEIWLREIKDATNA